MTPGVQEDRFDVAGIQGIQEGAVLVHGSDARDESYQMDGMNFKSPFGGGNTLGHYFGDGMIQAVSFKTSALPAEFELGGVGISMVLRDGGNDFRGFGFVGWAPASLQADNLTADLQARGLQTGPKLLKMYDANVSFGGPVAPDRIWFFGMYRRAPLNTYPAGLFNADGSRAIDDNLVTDAFARVTVQPNRANKIFAFYETDNKFRGHRRDTNADYQFIDSQAAIYQTSPTNFVFGIKWTSTLTSRLLLESGFSLNDTVSSRQRQPNVLPTDIPRIDFTKSTLTDSYVFGLLNRSFMGIYTGAVSYVTGAHAFKAGLQYGAGSYRVAQDVNGGMALRLSNGVANSVDLYNSPTNAVQNINLDLGAYVQDSWTIRQKLTLNLGARFSRFRGSLPEQTAPAGPWVGARDFAPVNNLPKFDDLVPRLGVAYDPAGKGRTVIKASASKYLSNEGTDISQSVNPMLLSTNRCKWTDLDGNGFAEPSEITACAGFSGSVSTTVDPNIVRPANWEFATGIDHELKPGFGVGAAYYRRLYINQLGTRNLAVTPNDYTPVTITNPLTLAPLTVFNQTLATRGLQNNFQTNDQTLDIHYNGVEFRGNARLKHGAFVSAALTVGRKEGPTSTTNLNNPNVLINYIGALPNDATYQTKVSGSYPLPHDFSVSGAFQSSTGWPLARTFTVTTAQVPNLTQVTQNVSLVPAGDVRLAYKNLLDLRATKVVRLGTRRVELKADLFNVLNNNAPTAEVTAVGSSLGKPSNIVDPRTFRLSLDFVF
jgi:hypothetical protein